MNSVTEKLVRRLPSRLWWLSAKQRLGSCGRDVHLQKDGTYRLENLHIGDSVTIGIRAYLWAENSRIYIGDNVVMGHEVTIMAGNRNIELRGKFMCDIADAEKRPGDDRDVVIEEDVWVGARVMILNGVCIGRGAVIGAGSVVTKAVPPYCVVAGTPARVLRARGTIDEILVHEQKLYPEPKRFKRNELERQLGERAGNSEIWKTASP
jgi:acetyltransferase-like isoleucine patch superfamily enzyme